MSEKKIRIETTPSDGTENIGTTPAERKRKGLPAAGEAWKPAEHDMMVMGRLSRAIEGVPPAAMRRIAPWFSALLAEAMKEPPFLGEVQGQQWDAGARAWGQQNNPAVSNSLAQAIAHDYQQQANGAKKLG